MLRSPWSTTGNIRPALPPWGPALGFSVRRSNTAGILPRCAVLGLGAALATTGLDATLDFPHRLLGGSNRSQPYRREAIGEAFEERLNGPNTVRRREKHHKFVNLDTKERDFQRRQHWQDHRTGELSTIFSTIVENFERGALRCSRKDETLPQHSPSRNVAWPMKIGPSGPRGPSNRHGRLVDTSARPLL